MATRTTPDVLAGLGQGGDDALGAAMGPQVMALDIAVIRLDGGTQPRAGIDQAVVADYANDMEANGAEFPPVQVVYDGEAYWLWDGFHRLHARKRNGLHTAPAIVRQGTRRDAVLLSVGANATHGFRRSSEDKRRAVDTLLRDPEWSQWSDREIGRRCAVDGKTVAARRAALSAEIPQMETRRVERNGSEYTMAPAQRAPGAAVTAQEGKYATPEELEEQLRAWLQCYDKEQWEDALVDVVVLKEDSVWVRDLREWITVQPRKAYELKDAAVVMLREMRREKLSAAKAEDDARWEREQAEYRSKQAGAFVGALTPWTAEELEEELLGLDGVSLPGADEDWLFEYVTDMARRSGHSITQPVFDMAMRLATPRQVRVQELKDRLDRAQAQAMAADAERAIARGAQQVAETPERARSAPAGGFAQTGPSGEGQPVIRGREMEFERRVSDQGKTIKLYGRNVDGTLTVTVDARTVHLYSPGVTMTRDDAFTLLRMVRDAQLAVFDPKEMSNA